MFAMKHQNYRIPSRRAIVLTDTIDNRIFTQSSFVSEMTYTVSSGTLNSSIPYHTIILTLANTGAIQLILSQLLTSVLAMTVISPCTK